MPSLQLDTAACRWFYVMNLSCTPVFDSCSDWCQLLVASERKTAPVLQIKLEGISTLIAWPYRWKLLVNDKVYSPNDSIISQVTCIPVMCLEQWWPRPCCHWTYGVRQRFHQNMRCKFSHCIAHHDSVLLLLISLLRKK